MSTPPRPIEPPRTAVMVASACWALVLGWQSTVHAGLQPVLFHLAVWVPLVVLLWPLTRRGVEPAWRWMGLGIVLFALGDGAWDLIEAMGQAPDASWADAVYLAGYVVLAVGIITLLRAHGGAGQRNGLIDGLLLAIPTAVLITEFLVVPGDDATQTLAVRVVTAAYPLADTLLVAGLVWLLVMPGLARRAVVPLATGMFAALALDVAWATGSLLDAGALTTAVNGLYPASYVLLAIGVAMGAALPVAPEPDRGSVVPWGRVALLGAGLVAAPLAAVLAIVFSRRLQPVLVVAATLVAAALVVLRFVRVVSDLNRTTEELTTARNEIREQAVRDPLTGVYNRLALPEKLAVLTSGTGPPAALLSIDLDRFKQVNDLHGHQAGDMVLEAVANRLRANCRPQDAVIRMGGDEFLVLLWDVQDRSATELATRMVRAIEQPVPYRGEDLRVSASVGIALVGTGVALDDTDEILHRADVAMYEAKRSGHGVVQLALT
jgi:diguanylate cyclase (GGDEF)-like protein